MPAITSRMEGATFEPARQNGDRDQHRQQQQRKICIVAVMDAPLSRAIIQGLGGRDKRQLPT